MKTRLHTADVLTFTLTGAEPQRALTQRPCMTFGCISISVRCPAEFRRRLPGSIGRGCKRTSGDDRWTVKLLRCRGPGGFWSSWPYVPACHWVQPGRFW